jgi:hypothetical protein
LATRAYTPPNSLLHRNPRPTLPFALRGPLKSLAFGTSLFPPQEDLTALLEEILEVRVRSSRGRSNPRAVKRKMSNFPTKTRNPQRGTVRHWPTVEVLDRD